MVPDIFNLVAISSSFLFILLAEIGDKTLLMTVSLAARYKSILHIFLGSFLAEVLVSVIGISLGVGAGIIIPIDLTSRIAGILFIAFGIISLRKSKNEEDFKDTTKVPSFLMIFMLVATAEIGDKTQLATIAMAIEYQSWISVFLGVVAAFAMTSLIGVIVGRSLSKKLSSKLITKASAAFFLIAGAILLLGIF